jgi:L-aminoadipate-semialdehyde dehydrogenase
MPLNPNGKIDKPALPFPDTAHAYAARPQPDSRVASPTERTMRAIWSRILPSAPSSVPLDENFFDLGGHSILATRLIFEIRKTFVVNAPLGLIFDQPTIAGLSVAIESLRNADLGLTSVPSLMDSLASNDTQVSPKGNNLANYSQDFDNLLSTLRPSYPQPTLHAAGDDITIFLTGATGFLGSFILRSLLSHERIKKVICIVRSPTDAKAVERLRQSASDRGVWDEDWVRAARLEVLRGDLDQEAFGLDPHVWDRVCGEADVVLHNGALVRLSDILFPYLLNQFTPIKVHWVYPYERLRSANVLGTLKAIEFASLGRPKQFVFVSSTSAIDTDYYVRLSESLLQEGRDGVSEDDTLEGSRTGLKTGYGQSKWVSEKLLLEAGKRGLRGYIVRPGYIVGDATTAGA